MAFPRKKAAYGGRQPYKKRPYKKAAPKKFTRGYNQSSSAYTARFNRSRGAEKKWLDTTIQSQADMSGGIVVSSTAAGTGINYVKQGPAGFERIGTKFLIKWIEMKASAYLQAALVTTPTAPEVAPRLARMVLVLDRQANGALPASPGFAQVFNMEAQDLVTPDAIFAKAKVENDKRFQILFDETVELVNKAFVPVGSDVLTGGDVKSITWKHYFKGGGLEIEMGGSENTIANVKSNNLLCLAAVDSYNASQPVTVVFESRIRFTDY